MLQPDAAEQLALLFDAEMKKLVAMERSAPAKLREVLVGMQGSLSSLSSDRSDNHARRVLKHNIGAVETELEKLAARHYSRREDAYKMATVARFNELKQQEQNAKKAPAEAGAAGAAGAAGGAATRIEELVHTVKASKQLAPPRVQVVKDDAVCAVCGCEELRVHQAKSVNVCQTCGASSLILDTTASSLSFGDDVVFSHSFSYMRANHFAYWLARIQAKETLVVEESVVEKVMEELAKRDVHPADVTQPVVLATMKAAKMKSKVYNHAAQVTMRITGKPPPRLTSEQDELCKLIFNAIQAPFEKHAPAERKNFLSYSYALYKILDLLGARELLCNIPLLSGRGKIKVQDEIMRKIFADLNIEFVAYEDQE